MKNKVSTTVKKRQEEVFSYYEQWMAQRKARKNKVSDNGKKSMNVSNGNSKERNYEKLPRLSHKHFTCDRNSIDNYHLDCEGTISNCSHRMGSRKVYHRTSYNRFNPKYGRKSW